jgi:regulatory protein
VAALRKLAHRDRSKEEVRRALATAGYDEAVVEAVLLRLTRDRYLDDAGYAARVARTRLRFDGLGRHRIRQDLRARGVAREVAEVGLAEALTEVPEAETLDRVAQRYWRTRVSDEPRDRLRKLWAYLVRRGFPSDLVRARLAELWPRWREALDGLEAADDTGD